jgi:hypothetical protein
VDYSGDEEFDRRGWLRDGFGEIEWAAWPCAKQFRETRIGCFRGEEIGGDLEWTDFFFLFLNQTALINKISSHYNQEDYWPPQLFRQVLNYGLPPAYHDVAPPIPDCAWLVLLTYEQPGPPPFLHIKLVLIILWDFKISFMWIHISISYLKNKKWSVSSSP